MLESIYIFFSKIWNEFSELRNYDGDIVDELMGKMSSEQITKIALHVAKEKEWIGKSGQPELSAEKPVLFHYTRKSQLVWSVYFIYYFTEEERKNKDIDSKSITLAVVKIDDATGEILPVDSFRPYFNDN
jgi:hypothetical protein